MGMYVMYTHTYKYEYNVTVVLQIGLTYNNINFHRSKYAN